MKIRLPRVQRKYRKFGWVMTVVTLAPENGGWVTITDGGDITIRSSTPYTKLMAECMEYLVDRAAKEHPWIADAALNLLFFDYRPLMVKPRVTGLRVVRPAVTEAS